MSVLMMSRMRGTEQERCKNNCFVLILQHKPYKALTPKPTLTVTVLDASRLGIVGRQRSNGGAALSIDEQR